MVTNEIESGVSTEDRYGLWISLWIAWERTEEIDPINPTDSLTTRGISKLFY